VDGIVKTGARDLEVKDLADALADGSFFDQGPKEPPPQEDKSAPSTPPDQAPEETPDDSSEKERPPHKS